MLNISFGLIFKMANLFFQVMNCFVKLAGDWSKLSEDSSSRGTREELAATAAED